MTVTSELLNEFLLWLAVFCGGWGLWMLLMRKGIHYISRPIFTSFYFFAWSAITAIAFKDIVEETVANAEYIFLFAAACCCAGHFLIFFLLRRFVGVPASRRTAYPADFNLPMSYRYIVPKYFELLFQQATIIALTFLLREAGLGILGIALAFAIVFGGLHLPLIRTMGKFFGWYYTVFAALSGLVFPTLILSVSYGFIYSYAVHAVFYMATATFFSLYFARREYRPT